jgi:hypothetical protein
MYPAPLEVADSHTDAIPALAEFGRENPVSWEVIEHGK